MITLDLVHARPGLRHVLCIGAHADDIEIGCGGALLTLLAAQPALRVTWAVFSGDDARADEARASADALLAGGGGHQLLLHRFRDGYFPHEGAPLKDAFRELLQLETPDVVFTHHHDDRHQDHRTLAELTAQTFRDHLVLEYEIPKTDGGLGMPNVFLPLEEGVVRRKVDHLLTHFPSQRSKRWFTEDLFRGLMRLRGMECNAPSGCAEAFHTRTLVLG